MGAAETSFGLSSLPRLGNNFEHMFARLAWKTIGDVCISVKERHLVGKLGFGVFGEHVSHLSEFCSLLAALCPESFNFLFQAIHFAFVDKFGLKRIDFIPERSNVSLESLLVCLEGAVFLFKLGNLFVLHRLVSGEGLNDSLLDVDVFGNVGRVEFLLGLLRGFHGFDGGGLFLLLKKFFEVHFMFCPFSSQPGYMNSRQSIGPLKNGTRVL